MICRRETAAVVCDGCAYEITDVYADTLKPKHTGVPEPVTLTEDGAAFHFHAPGSLSGRSDCLAYFLANTRVREAALENREYERFRKEKIRAANSEWLLHLEELRKERQAILAEGGPRS